MKKAQTGILTIKNIIIFSVVAIILLLFANSMYKTVSSSSDKDVCKLSIISAAKVEETDNFGLSEAIFGSSLQCSYNDIKINSGKSIDHDKVNRVFAEELYECYTKTAQGKYNPYGTNWGDEYGDSVCLVCSIIDTSDLDGKTLEGLNLFLMSKNVPGEKFSFYEGLYGPVSDSLLKDAITKYNQGKDKFDLQDEYAIVWRVSRENTLDKIQGAVTEAGKVYLSPENLGATIALGLINPAVGTAYAAASVSMVGLVAFGGVLSEAASSENNFYSNYYMLPSSSISKTTSEVFKDDLKLPLKGGFSDNLFCDNIIMESKK